MAGTTYFHGSAVPFEPGATLAPRGGAYEADWSGTDFYAALERWRPPGLLAHRDAVFLLASEDEIELAGGATDWALEVEPLGPVTRHDLNWSAEVAALVGAGAAHDDPAVARAASAYWSGRPHPSESLWEHLAPAARVLACAAFDAPGPAP